MKVKDTYNNTLRMNDTVKIVKIGGDKLEGRTGQLVGASNFCVGMIYWIVRLDYPTHDDTMGFWTQYVTMPSVCLELVINRKFDFDEHSRADSRTNSGTETNDARTDG
jgi:hypothetical protein